MKPYKTYKTKYGTVKKLKDGSYELPQGMTGKKWQKAKEEIKKQDDSNQHCKTLKQ